MSDVVLYEVADRVATITLNRPEARNALSSEVLRPPARAAPAGPTPTDDVDVVILTGADPAFCAGLDLKELGSPAATCAAPGSRRGPARPRHRRRAAGAVPAIAKPVIGAINGVAVTGGFELALACDFLIASERARFADTHARVGIMPGWGLTVLLPQAVGVRRARELSLTGNFLDAETALAWGLVNHVVAHDDLLPTCRQLAADIVVQRPGRRPAHPAHLRRERVQLPRATGWRTESAGPPAPALESGGGSGRARPAARPSMAHGRAPTT